LGKHPLSKFKCVQKRMAPAETGLLALGRAVSATLQAAIEELKPDDQNKLISQDARFFVILHYTFIERESADRVALRLRESRRNYYRQRVNAIRVVAEIVLDWEARSAP
jgi:hypothetical protein